MPESKTHTKIEKKIQQKENRLLREIKNTHRDREENTIKKKTDCCVKAKTHTEIEKKNNKKKTYCCVKIKTYTKIEKKKTNKNISLRESKTNESKVALRAREIVLKS